jgi:Family of unknown function (DUF6338)
MEKLFENERTLLLFLVFFIPGFISLKMFDLFIPSERRDFSKSAFDAVAYSSLNFVALFWLIALMRSGIMASWLWYVSLLFVCIIAPSIWPVGIIWARNHPRVVAHIPAPISGVWDAIFAQRQQYWVIIHLKDQRRIGGVYSTCSFTSSSPAPPQIFLEEVWQLSEAGVFLKPIESSAGILVLGEEILGLEFFRYNELKELVNAGQQRQAVPEPKSIAVEGDL